MTEGDMANKSPEDLTSLHKEIDLIQGCISRMAHNSFLIKGWTITIIVITWAILGKESLSSFALLLLLIPIIGFWCLDAYFLWVEKMYRNLYSSVLNNRLKLNNKDDLYNLDPNRFKKETGSWWKVFFSKTIFIFYGCLCLVILIVLLLSLISAVYGWFA